MEDPRRMTQGGAQQQEPPGDDTGAPGSEPAQDEAESPQEASGGQPGGDASGQQPSADESAAQDSGAMQQASPEEQQQYNQFVGRAMQLIYDQKLFPHLVEMLRGGSGGGQDQGQQSQQEQQQGQSSQGSGVSGPAAGLANATAMIIVRVYKAASDAGANLSPDVVFHGGTEIFGQLAEISDKAGISDYANDRDKLEGAYFLAVDQATEQLRKAGVVDEAESKAALQQLHDMDAKGELEQVFRQLDARDQQAGGAEQESPEEDQAEGGVEEPPTKGGMAPKEMN